MKPKTLTNAKALKGKTIARVVLHHFTTTRGRHHHLDRIDFTDGTSIVLRGEETEDSHPCVEARLYPAQPCGYCGSVNGEAGGWCCLPKEVCK